LQRLERAEFLRMSAQPIPARHKDVNRAKVCDDNFVEFVRGWNGRPQPRPSPD
jgi:2-oxoisovalerate dehydrogenase E1 component